MVTSDIVYMEFKGYGFTVTVEESRMVVNADNRVTQGAYGSPVVVIPYHTIVDYKYGKGNIFVNASIKLTFMDDVSGERKIFLTFIPMGVQKRNALMLHGLLESKINIIEQ